MDMVERMSEGMDKKPKAVIVRCNVCHSIARRTDRTCAGAAWLGD